MKTHTNIIPIFISADDNYSPLVATTIISTCSNTKKLCKFYVLDGGIKKDNIKKIESLKQQFLNLDIEFVKVDVEKFFKDVSVKNNLSLSAFNRLLIPNLVKDLKKIIYLDVDVIVLSDITNLYKVDLENNIIGAVPDNGAVPEYYNKIKSILELGNDSIYFNSGVMLIDCERWRNKVELKDLLEIEKKYRETRLYNDQDVLNKYFDKKYKILDKKFNVMYEDNDAIEIRHLSDRIKPWNFSKNSYNKIYKNLDDFWKYAEISPFDSYFQSKIQNQPLQDSLIAKYLTKKIAKLQIKDANIIESAINLNYIAATSLATDIALYFTEFTDKIENIIKLSFGIYDKKYLNAVVGLIISCCDKINDRDLFKNNLEKSNKKVLQFMLDENNPEELFKDLLESKSYEKFIIRQLSKNVRKNMKKDIKNA